MITLLVFFTIIMLISFAAALIQGIIVITPVALIFIALPVIDILVFRILINKNRKES